MIRFNKVQMEEKLKVMIEFLNSVEEKQKQENGQKLKVRRPA